MVCALACVAGTAVRAAEIVEEGHGHKRVRALIDLEKDGKVDHGELRAALEELVGKIDADKDGKVDHGELKAKLDTDKDGKVDHGELRAALQGVKAKLDTDKDGKIDHGEARAALRKLRENHPKLFAWLMERIKERRERRLEKAGDAAK